MQSTIGTFYPGMTLLISVLVLGAVAIVVGSGVAIRGIEEVDISRSTMQTSEALAVADACVEEALLQIKRENTAFTGTSLTIGDGSCTVSVTGTAPTYVLSVSGTVLQWTRDIAATITYTGSTISKVEW